MLNNAFRAMRISASGLAAERMRMDLISSNIANYNSIRTEGQDSAYKRKVAVFQEHLDRSKSGIQKFKGVKVARIMEDNTPSKMVYDPDNPYANAEGFVETSNVNILNEMADMIMATRAYESNAETFNANKQMFMKALEIGR